MKPEALSFDVYANILKRTPGTTDKATMEEIIGSCPEWTREQVVQAIIEVSNLSGFRELNPMGQRLLLGHMGTHINLLTEEGDLNHVTVPNLISASQTYRMLLQNTHHASPDLINAAELIALRSIMKSLRHPSPNK